MEDNNNPNPSKQTESEEKVAEQSTTAEVEQVVAEAPAVQPGDAVVPGKAGDEPVAVVVKPPKKKVGRVIGIVIAALIVLGLGSLLFYYFAIYSNPDRVAFDAVKGVLSAERVNLTGKVELFIDDDEMLYNSAYVEFRGAGKGLPYTSAATLVLGYKDKANAETENELRLELGSAIMSNGVIYVRVGNLANLLEEFLDVQDMSLGDLDELGDIIADVVDLVDNEWWEISIDDLLSNITDDDTASVAEDFYNCAIEVYQKDYSNEYIELYSKNQFAAITPTGGAGASGNSVYEVDFDAKKLASFVNSLPETTLATEITSCYNTAAKKADFPELDLDEADEVSAEDFESETIGSTLYLETSNFGHQLNRIYGDAKNKKSSKNSFDYQLSWDLELNYEKTEISAPSEYRPIGELIDEIGEILEEYQDMDEDFEIDFDDLEFDVEYNEDEESDNIL